MRTLSTRASHNHCFQPRPPFCGKHQHHGDVCNVARGTSCASAVCPKQHACLWGLTCKHTYAVHDHVCHTRCTTTCVTTRCTTTCVTTPAARVSRPGISCQHVSKSVNRHGAPPWIHDGPVSDTELERPLKISMMVERFSPDLASWSWLPARRERGVGDSGKMCKANSATPHQHIGSPPKC